FSGSHLDRADHIRNDPAALLALQSSEARLLRLDGLDAVLADDGALTWGTLADAEPGSEMIFLGLDGPVPCFAEVPGATPLQGPHATPVNWHAMAVLDSAELAAYGG